MKAPFPITPALTAIAIAYRNSRMIADNVLPRVPVSKQEFKYRKFALADGFTLPDTKVGRTSQPNQVEFGFTEATDATRDYALDDPIPQVDIENAPDGYDPVGRSTEQITNLILLDREVRVANKVFNANTYATANKTTLTGTGQWSDFANSDPLGTILAALDGCVMRPNIGILGRPVWTKLRQHPKVVKAVLGNSGDSGVASLEAVAQLLELEALYVGEAWLNSAKKGQAANLQRTWGKHVSFIYRDQLATADSGVTFGFSAQFGNRVAGSIADEDIGMRGGQRVRVGESVQEVICANDLGYFFQNAVA